MYEIFARSPGPFGVDADDPEAVEAMLNRLLCDDQQEAGVPKYRPSVSSLQRLKHKFLY